MARSITGKTKQEKLSNFDRFFAYIAPAYERGGLKVASDIVFDMMNIYPNWTEKDERQRTRLCTEGGFAVANHPMAPLDVFSVINALHTEETGSRKDFKILVCEEIYMDAYRKNFEPTLFVAPSELSTPAGFESVIRHIEGGGIFIVFPSGVNEKDVEDMRFFDGFGDLLLRVKPDTMVYSFFVHPEDTDALKKKHPGLLLGLYTQVKLHLPRLFNTNRWRKADTFRVDEWYAQAGQWQKVISGVSDKTKYGDLLADFYRTRFVVEK